MKAKWLAVLSTACLLCTLLTPFAVAEAADETGTIAETQEVIVRLEAEDIDLTQAFLQNASKLNAGKKTELKSVNGFSGGNADGYNGLGAQHGDVYYLGLIETTDLVDIRFSLAANQACHYVFFAKEGATPDTEKDISSTLGSQLGDITANSGDWQKAKTFSLGKAPSCDNNHIPLFLKVWTGGIANGCGNLDYIDLVYSKPATPEESRSTTIQAEDATLTKAKAKTNAAFIPHDATGKPNFVGDTDVGSILNFGTRDVTGLTQIHVTFSCPYSVTYAFYADDQEIARAVLEPTCPANVFTRCKTYGIPVNTVPTGEHELRMEVITKGQYGAGNIDYIELIQVPVETPTKSVKAQFVTKNGMVVAEKDVTSAEELIGLKETLPLPALGGYACVNWDEDDDALRSLYDAAAEGDTLTVTAIYEVDTTKTYTITVTDAEASATTNLTFDSSVTVKATGDAAPRYWLLDDAKVGFGQTEYTFYVSGDNHIQPIFYSEVPNTPEVVLQQAVGATGSDVHTLSVIAQTSVPAGYILKECGVYYTGTVNVLKALKDNVTAVDENTYVQVVSSKKAGQQYMAHLLNVQSDKTRYAIAYAVITDGTTETTIWSNTVVQFKTTADGATCVKGSI